MNTITNVFNGLCQLPTIVNEGICAFPALPRKHQLTSIAGGCMVAASIIIPQAIGSYYDPENQYSPKTASLIAITVGSIFTAMSAATKALQLKALKLTEEAVVISKETVRFYEEALEIADQMRELSEISVQAAANQVRTATMLVDIAERTEAEALAALNALNEPQTPTQL